MATKLNTTRRFRYLLTARVIIEWREHTLFLMQKQERGGDYTLPGGKVDGDEFAKEALIREAQEEIGIKLTKKKLKLVHIQQRKLQSLIEVIFYFHATSWEGTPSILEPEKFSSFKWIPSDELPSRLPAALKDALLKIENAKNYSQFEPKTKVKLKKEKKKIED